MLNQPEYFYGSEVIEWMSFELPYVLTDEEKKEERKQKRKAKKNMIVCGARSQRELDEATALMDDLNNTVVLDDLPF